MISALSWIPRGACKALPTAPEFTEEELAAAKQAALDEAEASSGEDADANEGSSDSEKEDTAAEISRAKAFASAMKTTAPSGARMDTSSLDAAMAELDMDKYDDEEEEGVKGIFGNTNPGMTYYANNDEDPYIELAGAKDIDSEAEDNEIKGDDLVLLTARHADDVSHLEVWIYEEAEAEGGSSNQYVHHDVLLPAFPLCLAWMDCGPNSTNGGQKGNFAAVGTMNPGIEIWDLDVLDSVEPVAKLGGELDAPVDNDMEIDDEADPDKKKKKKKKSKKKRGKALKEGSHTDAVMGLSWNLHFRNVLASCAADTTVKVWDVATSSCQSTLDWHSDKVQAVAWNPADAPVLLSAGFDQKAILGDTRAADQTLAWTLSADAEALAWDPFNPTRFLVSSEDGIVAAFDARSGADAKPLFRLSAHDRPACSLSFNPAAAGLLATASTDKQVKLWDVSGEPSLVAAQELNAGAIFSASFSPEKPSLFAVAGAKGELVIWDVLTSSAVANRYSRSLSQ